jgi:hypothetical protein
MFKDFGMFLEYTVEQACSKMNARHVFKYCSYPMFE